MTAALLTRPALAVGESLLGAAGRAGYWAMESAFNLGSAVVGRYARAPLASTAILAVTALSAMAASNALYFQTMQHPSPFFSDPVIGTAGIADPELSGDPNADTADRSAPLVIRHDATETATVSEPVAPTIGNTDVAAIQQKLAEMNLFSGTVDGYYGPKTASAIRAFEQANGLTPQGALSPDVMDAILRAPTVDAIVMQQPVVEPQPEPVVLQTASIVEPVLRAEPEPEPEAQPLAELEPLPELLPEADIVATIEPVDTPEAIIEAAVTETPMPPALEATAATGVLAEPEPELTVAAYAATDPAAEPMIESAASDADTVMKIQRGLASLGFLHGTIDGVAGEATAKAIRNFEVFYSYKVTGQMSPDLVELLISKGAVI